MNHLRCWCGGTVKYHNDVDANDEHFTQWYACNSCHTTYPDEATVLRMMKRVPLKGAVVSVDVSTGDQDAGNRIFARIEDIQSDNNGGHIYLATEEHRNFGPAPDTVALPLEPTQELLEAGFGHHYRLETTLGRQKAVDDYLALLAAAPQ